jgi:hypothetical protein
MLKPWSDMVDAESIHFALIGKRKTLQKNEPVIVITCDRKEAIEQRLESLYRNLCDIGNKGFVINICPGTIYVLGLYSILHCLRKVASGCNLEVKLRLEILLLH